MLYEKKQRKIAIYHKKCLRACKTNVISFSLLSYLYPHAYITLKLKLSLERCFPLLSFNKRWNKKSTIHLIL
jgi:hypothetical protein